MSIYDKSSLVLIPSGTKSGKVFSQKPVNGDGDFTFSRSTAATRVNADGNIEKETQNLLLQSNNFDTTWTLDAGMTLTSGQSGYDGTSNAWLLDKPATNFREMKQLVAYSGVSTYSIYAKSASLTAMTLRFVDGVANHYARFNLATGSTISSTGNVIDMVMTDVGGGWYRCSTTIGSITGNQVYVYPDIEYNTTAGSIYIQDAQLEQGLVARDYIETTTAAVEGGITDNVPRLDYTDSSCPALLLEPQRTNELGNSEYFGAWNNTSYPVTITSNAITSPDGNTNAALVTPTSGSSRHATRDLNISGVSGATYTLSAFYKKAGSRYVVLGDSGDSLWHLVTADLDNGTITDETYATGTIEPYENDWYRITCTYTYGGTGSVQTFLGASPVNTNTSAPTFDDTSLTTYVYGAQVEQGSYATSYIPTYGTSVTRNAEGCYKTGISSLIGQTEGTMFIDFDYKINSGNMRFSLSDNSGVNWIFIATPESGITNASRFYYRANNVVQIDRGASAYFTDGQQYKLAFAYKSGDWAIYGNGTLLYSGTNTFDSFTLPLQQVNFVQANAGTAGEKLPINQSIVFKTRLSNEELAALTTI